MTCQELDRLLYPYLDGEFQPEERVDLETHLAGCANCTRRVEQERQIQQALRRAARHSVQSSRAPDSLRAGIQLGLRQQQRRAFHAQMLKFGAAAALAVVVVGGAWISVRQEQRQSRVAELIKRHGKQLPYDIDLSRATPEQINQLLTKLDHPVALIQLPKARQVGARVSQVQDREAVYVSYESESGRRLGVFAIGDPRRELPAEPFPSVDVESSDGHTVVVWRDDEVVYEMVGEGDLSEADILEMVRARQRSAGVANANLPPPVKPELNLQQVSHAP
jgi:mycothiol system anti-sigma-R factor